MDRRSGSVVVTWDWSSRCDVPESLPGRAVGVSTAILPPEMITATVTGTISVLVTHRFSSVRDADLILVLDNGRLVESGTHEDLVTREGGLYHRLYRLHADYR